MAHSISKPVYILGADILGTLLPSTFRSYAEISKFLWGAESYSRLRRSLCRWQ